MGDSLRYKDWFEKAAHDLRGAQTTIDYYREKTRKPCPVRLPSFFLKMAEICAIPTKPLRRKAFRLDSLITPTLKAAGSNPVGHTIRWQQFGYFKRNA